MHDDGNPILRKSALKALGVRHALSIITAWKKSKEIRPVDPAALATLIIASLEGALVIAINCRVRRRSSIINLRSSGIALAILKLAFSQHAESFT
jgi:hypothetical protein